MRATFRVQNGLALRKPWLTASMAQDQKHHALPTQSLLETHLTF